MNIDNEMKKLGYNGDPYDLIYFKEIDFKKEIAEYGNTLDYEEKEVCRQIFTDLLNAGYDYDFLYFTIYKLNGQDIIKYRYLPFNKEFQSQVKWEIDRYYKLLGYKKEHQKLIGEGIKEQMEKYKQIPTIKIPRKPKEIEIPQMHWEEIENSTDE